jgi:undecaprenyl diphosphate synthase
MRKLAHKVRAGELLPEDIGTSEVEASLDTVGLPPVDLLVRTSGERRVSNFLLWQIAYAEMVFVKDSWPDFGAEAFVQVLREFSSRERRYGMTSAQIASGQPGTF